MAEYYLNQRRQRANPHIRELAADLWLNHKQFIQPMFIEQNLANKTPSLALNKVFMETQHSLSDQVASDLEQGISKFLLFPIPDGADQDRFDFDFIANIVRRLKEQFAQKIWLAVDLCLCAYTDHGHCGFLNNQGDQIDNSKSVAKLTEYAYLLAQAGVDSVAPSDMLDGRIQAIRNRLNQEGFDQVAIMSYSSKFASSLYGPFRDICNSSPDRRSSLKDRRSYQISMVNTNDAVATSLRDIREGADVIMVKPGLPYLDIIYRLKEEVDVPIAVYQVSGEYQSIELMVQHNYISRHQGHLEFWTAMVRSGANIIISYAARNAKTWIEQMEY